MTTRSVDDLDATGRATPGAGRAVPGVDEIHHDVLLELGLSLAGEPELSALLSRTLPLLLQRTGGVYVGLVRVDAAGTRTEQVLPRAMGNRDEWATIVATAVDQRPQRDGWCRLELGPEHLHLFDLPDVGVLVLGCSQPLEPAFVAGFLRFVGAFRRACLAGMEHERRGVLGAELVEVQDRQRALLDNLPFAAWMTDDHARLTVVNEPFARAAGCTRDAAIGRTVGEVLSGGAGRMAAEVTEAALSTRQPIAAERDHPASEVTAVGSESPTSATGVVCTVEHHAGPITSRSGRVLGATGYLRDVTARVTTERRLDHQARFQRVLMDLAVGFVNVPLDELDEAIERALAITGRFTGVDRAYLFAYDLERRTATNTHEWCGPGIEPQIQHLQSVAMDELGEWLEPHLRGEVMHVPRVSEREPGDPIRELLEAQDVETVIAVPLIDGDRCLGFVGFDAVGEGRAWAEEELALLDVLAELFTNALVRTEREDAMLAARREAETARERLGLALSATRDAIFDHDVSTGRIHISPRWWEMLGIAEGPTDTDVDTVLDLVHPDEVAELVDQYEAALRGDQSTLRVETRLRHHDGHHVPVLARSRILRDEEGRALRVVGSNLDITHRKRREAVARRQLELETTLATVSARFVGLDAFDAALDAALGDVGRLCGADLVFLATTDAAGRLRPPDHVWRTPWSQRQGDASPRLAAASGLESRLRAGEAVHCGDGPAAEVGDTADGSAELGPAQDADAGGQLAVPLLVGGELVGVLGLERPDPAGAWNDADVTAVRAVAEVLAGALARARAEAELRANERKHRRTVEHLHEVVFRIDAQGRWAYLNPVWEQLTGRSVADSLGALARDSFHPDDRDRALTTAGGAVGGTEASRGELRLLTRDDEVRWVEVVVQPELDEEGRLVGSIGSLNDVTERREDERALVEAKQAAEAASEAKTRFISTVSHELRTPLNGVIGMLELLLGRSLPPEAAGQVRAARRSASSLLTLVDDLLDIAKIEAGRLELQRRPVNLSALVEEVSEVVAAAAADRGLELRVGVGDEVPSAVLGDGGRLRQLLVNLLGNAVKFTDEGHVGLEVDLVAPVRGGTAPLAFTVTDTGAGIDPEVVPTLFEAFTQADQSATRRVGGTGLGLAIVRQLTELMDGRISVDSEPGVGSTFRLELDLEVAAGTPDEDAAASRSTRAPAPELRRVLVVEDNDVNQQLAQAHLEDLGCEVTVVADGEVGAATALSGAYDLVLMDCLMPGVDGFEATRRIRAAEPPDRRTPIIAVTADATFEHATVCRGAGMDDVLAKPYGRADLAAVLERHEVPPPGPARAHDAASSDDDGDGGSGPVQVPLGDDEVVFDPRPLELLRRDVADARLVERVLRSYADRAPDLLEQLAAGLAAGEPAVVSSNCHALVASSAAVGAVLVERLARRVDGAATDGVGAQRRVAEQQDLVAELRSAVARTVDEHGRYLDRLAAHR